MFKVAVLSPLIKTILKCVPTCFNGEGIFTAAAVHVSQIVVPQQFPLFCLMLFYFKVILLLLLEGFGKFPEQVLYIDQVHALAFYV